jgi:hypothetical protein
MPLLMSCSEVATVKICETSHRRTEIKWFRTENITKRMFRAVVVFSSDLQDLIRRPVSDFSWKA